jgi:copper transport protein
MKLSIRLAAILGPISILGLVAIWLSSTASAQELDHGSHSEHAAISTQELAVSLAHGTAQGAAVFLTGLVTFVVLVWLPIGRVEDADQEKIINLFCRWMRMLVGLLIVAGLVELPLYAVSASGEALSLGLLEEALFDTRVGQLWSVRLVLGLLTVAVATHGANLRRSTYAANLRRSAYAANLRHSSYWWATAVVVGALLLMTFTQQSHAVAEGSFLPVAADWLHVMAASLWMGGVLGFPILLMGPLRAMQAETRAKLLRRTVPRFSKIAVMAVMSLILTGLIAALLHVPNLSALIDTPYGRALSMKLGLLIFLLALGVQNLRLQGREPFGRLVSFELVLAIGIFVATGFLTSLPPADVAQQQTIEQNSPNPTHDIHQPPMPQLPVPGTP